MFGWIRNMFRNVDKAETPIVEVHPADCMVVRTAEEIARIRARNRDLIKQAAIKLNAHKFSSDPV